MRYRVQNIPLWLDEGDGALLRRVARTWWLWGAAVAMAFLVVGAVIAPVAIVPLFNSPRRLADQRVVAQVPE